MLKGKDVTLRPIEFADLDTARAMLADDEVSRYLMIRYPISDYEEQQWYQSKRPDKDMVFAIEDTSGVYIGNIGIHNINYADCTCIIGIFIGSEEHRGRRLGKQVISLILDFAFNEMNMELLYLDTFDYNERGQRCYEGMGFTSEGIQRRRTFKEGRYIDRPLYSYTKKEWKEKGKLDW